MGAESGPIQVAEPGAGFQYSPFGMLQLGTSVAPESDDPSPAAVRVVTAPAVSAQAPALQQSNRAWQTEQPVHSSCGSVIKAARSRVKEIKAELRRMGALKRELDELERLLKAAKQKPEPRVRALRSA